MVFLCKTHLHHRLVTLGRPLYFATAIYTQQDSQSPRVQQCKTSVQSLISHTTYSTSIEEQDILLRMHVVTKNMPPATAQGSTSHLTTPVMLDMYQRY
jgi:hypothetical protein